MAIDETGTDRTPGGSRTTPGGYDWWRSSSGSTTSTGPMAGESWEDYWRRRGSGDSNVNDPSGFWDTFRGGAGGNSSVDPGMFDKFNLNFDPYTSWLQKQGAIPTDPFSNLINGSPSVALGGNYVDPNHLGPISTQGTISADEAGRNWINRIGGEDLTRKVFGGEGGPAAPDIPAPDLSFLSQGGGGGAGADFYTWLANQRASAGNPQLQRTSIDWTGYGSGMAPPPRQPTPTPYSAYPGAPAPPPAGGATTYPENPIVAQGVTPAPPPTPTGGFRPGGILGSTSTQPPAPVAPTPPKGGGASAMYRAPDDGTDDGYAPPAPMPTPSPAPAAPKTSEGAPIYSPAPAAGGTSPMAKTAPEDAAPPPPPPPGGYSPVSFGSRAGPPGAGQAAITNRPAMTPTNQAATSDSLVRMEPRPPPPTPGGEIPSVGQYANPVFQQQQQTRREQQGLLGRLRSDMEGGAPSLAQLQLRRGTDENIAAANAIAASQGPGNAAAAGRQAALSAARANQDLVGQSAALRAQEYVQARQEATGLANQLRVNDLMSTGMSYDNAFKQAQLEADQAKTQLGADVQMAGIRAGQEQGLLDLGQRDKALGSEERMHVADLLMQKYGIDKGVAVQMANQPGMADYIMRGAATGGAVGGLPGAAIGGLAGWLYGENKGRP